MTSNAQFMRGETCQKCRGHGEYQAYTLPEGRPVIDYCSCVFGVLLHLAHHLQRSRLPIEPYFMDDEGAVDFINGWLVENGFAGSIFVNVETQKAGKPFSSEEEIPF